MPSPLPCSGRCCWQPSARRASRQGLAECLQSGAGAHHASDSHRMRRPMRCAAAAATRFPTAYGMCRSDAVWQYIQTLSGNKCKPALVTLPHRCWRAAEPNLTAKPAFPAGLQLLQLLTLRGRNRSPPKGHTLKCIARGPKAAPHILFMTPDDTHTAENVSASALQGSRSAGGVSGCADRVPL